MVRTKCLSINSGFVFDRIYFFFLTSINLSQCDVNLLFVNNQQCKYVHICIFYRLCNTNAYFSFILLLDTSLKTNFGDIQNIWS